MNIRGLWKTGERNGTLNQWPLRSWDLAFAVDWSEQKSHFDRGSNHAGSLGTSGAKARLSSRFDGTAEAVPYPSACPSEFFRENPCVTLFREIHCVTNSYDRSSWSILGSMLPPLMMATFSLVRGSCWAWKMNPAVATAPLGSATVSGLAARYFIA